ncbi:MAG: helix-turn-helix domain-containing protein [Kineosporiaceae bacterium]|nr:helix-turn-helix domain-containing protein [Kineosporiaceae bacterium]MBK7621180.1 helix-turn-helix domain-containing protein [Kineosporiaceae bacterium]
MVHRVVGLLTGEVVTFDLAIADQVFGGTPGYSWTVCTDVPGMLPTETGLQLRVDRGLGALRSADTIVVPGLGRSGWPVPEPELAALRRAAARGVRLVSICTGAFVLAAAGVLDGRRATTHWRYAARLQREFPLVEVDPDVLFVDDGQVLTSAGLAAGLDLCLHVVRRDRGAAAATALARHLVVAPHRAGGQAQFIERPVPDEPDAGLAATREWVLQRLAEPWSVERLARHARCSSRTFARRFRAETGTTPAQWLIGQRVAEAQRLLELTDLPVEQVADRVGFGAGVTLRQHFVRALGVSPTAYRTTFRGTAGR